MNNQNNISKYVYLFFAISFSVLAGLIRFYLLYSEKYAVGTDSYYYVVQLVSMKERGFFAQPDFSPSLYVLYLFNIFIKDPVLSNKVAVSVFTALLGIPLYKIGGETGPPKRGLVMIFVLLSTSAVNLFQIEFLKNWIAVFFLLWFLVFYRRLFFIRADFTIQFFKNAGFAILFSGLAFLSHKTTAGVVLVLWGNLFLLKYMGKKLIIIGSVITAVSVGLFAVVTVYLPNIISINDLSRFTEILSCKPQLAFYSWWKLRNAPVLEKIDIALIYFSPVLIVIFWQSIKDRKFFISMEILSLFLLFPFFNFDKVNTAYRLFMLMPIPASFFISELICLNWNNKLKLFGKKINLLNIKKCKIYLVYITKFLKIFSLTVITACLLLYQKKSFSQEIENSPMDFELYQYIVRQLNFEKKSLFIVHQGFDYYYWYVTGNKAFHFMPEEKHMDRPLYRLVHGVSPARFEKITGKPPLNAFPGFYILIEESDREKMINGLTGEEKKKYYTWMNPHIFRKGFMLRNQKFRKNKPK